jgi:hypothetical protein
VLEVGELVEPGLLPFVEEDIGTELDVDEDVEPWLLRLLLLLSLLLLPGLVENVVSLVVGRYTRVELALSDEEDEATAALEDEVAEMELLLLLLIIGDVVKVDCLLEVDEGVTEVGDELVWTGVVAEVTGVLEDEEPETKELLLLLLTLVSGAVDEVNGVLEDKAQRRSCYCCYYHLL